MGFLTSRRAFSQQRSAPYPYVTDRVEELTLGEQHPVTAEPTSLRSFPLARPFAPPPAPPHTRRRAEHQRESRTRTNSCVAVAGLTSAPGRQFGGRPRYVPIDGRSPASIDGIRIFGNDARNAACSRPR